MNIRHPFIAAISATALLTAVPNTGYAGVPEASTFGYTIAHQVNLRSEAGAQAPVIALLPVNTAVDVAEIIQKDKRNWAKVYIRSPISSVDNLIEGWLDLGVLDTEKPDSKKLFKAAKASNNPHLQRLFAERAFAMEPMSVEIPAFIETLIPGSDPATAKRLQTILSGVRQRQPVSDEPVKKIYDYYGGVLKPFAEVRDQKITMITGKTVGTPEYFTENRYYPAYSGNTRTGLVRTEMRIFKSDSSDVQGVLASYLPDAAVPDPENFNGKDIHSMVTNYALAPDRAKREVNAQEKALLKKLTLQWIQQQPKSERQNLLKVVQNESVIQQGDVKLNWYSGHMNQSGQQFLIGQWTFSSPSDAHYNNDPFYAALVMIAEQQADGSFKLARGSGNLYCEVDSLVDLNGDGTDEIYVECQRMEDASYYKILQRGKAGWDWVPEKTR